MDLNVFYGIKKTPAYVFDENSIETNLLQLVSLREKSGCRVLYSIKALPLGLVLNKVKDYVDGFSTSSLFEARLAKEFLGDTGSIHITTPGLRDSEFDELKQLCTHISFNSVSQYQRFMQSGIQQGSLGLRLNPKLSFSKDQRFDPCRQHSKLGIDIDIVDFISKKIEGLHFHTVFSHQDYLSLEQTIATVKKKFGVKLARLKWINMGGGYLYNQIDSHQPFVEAVQQLKKEFYLDVYIEPGKAIVGDAGYLVSTIIDRFISDKKEVMVLDTSVNHHPEVFEYSIKPNLLEEDENGDYSCILAGSSCLAGDIFGEYQFKIMPKIGDKVVFSNVGAYSLIKANRFNGYNLPDVYWMDKTNSLIFVKNNKYEDYRKQWVG